MTPPASGGGAGANPCAGARIPETIARAATDWPDNVALVDGDVTITYAELHRHVGRAAAGLAALGVREGDHVGFLLAQGWRLVALLYGALHLGAVAVPLNLTWEPPELEHALAAAEVDVLVAGRAHRDRDLRAVLAELGLAECGARESARLPRIRTLIGDWGARGAATVDAVLASTAPDVAPSHAQVGYLMFTSGSTSRPKAALIAQEAALGVAEHVARRLQVGPGDRLLNVLPLYHCGGLVEVLLVAQRRAAAVSLFDGYRHEAMVASAWREQSSILVGFDVVTMRLVDSLLERHGRIPFRAMVTGPGRPIHDTLSRLGVDVVISYALTEASNVVSLNSPTDDLRYRRDSNGFPLPGVDVRVCDPETGRSLGPDADGEICFRGWNLMRGYHRAGAPPELELDADGYFHTGDYGTVDAGGRVYYRGRLGGMVKTGGENVSEFEVESFLMTSLPGIRQAAVIGAPDPRWGEVVVAFVEMAPGLSVDTASVRETSRGRLSGYKVPKVVIQVEAGGWPVTPTGKVRKDALARRLPAEALASPADPA